jgi:DNA-binding CsgD family transcriptional regulator
MHLAAEAPPLRDPECLPRMMDRIYAAASAEISWDQPFAEMCRIGGFDAGMLTSVDPSDHRPFILSAHGSRPLVEGIPRILPPNPLLTESVLGSAPGAIWRDDEIMSGALLRTTRFWMDWMQPNRFSRWSAVIIGRRDEQVVLFEVYARPDRPVFAGEAQHLLVRLAPHLARAWRLGEAFRAPDAEAAGPMTAGPDAEDLADIDRLRIAFGLTRAEARLACAIAEGRSPAEAAALFGRKLTTVRSQLRQVFAKTGTSRQAELVALLLGRSCSGGSPSFPTAREECRSASTLD